MWLNETMPASFLQKAEAYEKDANSQTMSKEEE
jgi:hypothetical protein